MNYFTLKVKTSLVFFILLLGYFSATNAQLQTSGIFSSGMVLQRGLNVPVWGTSVKYDTIIVTLNSLTDTAYADSLGKWKAILPSMSAGGPETMAIKNSKKTITYTNVYIGDVWLASGQSNMALKLSASTNGTAEASSANNQTIRQFYVNNVLGAEPTTNIPSGSAWTPATSANAGNFTAVGYYFAKYLQADTAIPIGIINASQGGARIEAFMSKEMLGFDETTVTLANGEPERQPTMAFNTMINPLVNFPIKGVIWYQGESNADNMNDAVAYSALFKKMITSWRNLWGLGDIPFLWVQLPNQGGAAVENIPGTWDAWPKLRAGQSRALSLPNTGEVTTIDVGDVDIHPKDKLPVGQRLSLVARKIAYGEDIVYSGPRYKDHSLLEDGHVKIHFDNVGSGLVAKNSVNDSIHWFSIAGKNGTLYSAKAILDGDSAIVWNENVPNPSIIRYAWEYNPTNVNFFNKEDLPTVPFLISVNDSFAIRSFTTTDTTIERGKSAVLAWETHGSSSTTLNNIPVDSTDGLRVWPKITTTYTLKAINKLDVNKKDSISLTVVVTDAMPTISIKTDLGDVVEPDTLVTITATATPPLGGSITKVEFFVDSALLFSDTTAPYKSEWTPSDTGEYKVTAVVTDNNGHSVASSPISILVTRLILIKYEAEKATYTGNGSVKTSSAVSGKKYMDMTDPWELIFNGVNVSEGGKYLLSIRYLLNYGGPKTQNLFVNGTMYSAVVFTAPDNTTWMTYRINIPLNAGDNVISIQGSWSWMSFDYVGITVKAPPVTNIAEKKNSGILLLQNSPNPFNAFTNISYVLPKSGYVSLEIFSVTGEQVGTLVNQNMSAGSHSIRFEPGLLPKGVYFAKLKFNNTVETQKMILVY